MAKSELDLNLDVDATPLMTLHPASTTPTAQEV